MRLAAPYDFGHNWTMRVILLVACLTPLLAEIREFPGGKVLPHEKYIHAVSELDSPVQQLYIKTKDGLYVAAALRKPKGSGPFPVLIHFHGAPGGRGMEQIAGWSRGDTGSPFYERFLQEGYVTVVSDYRGGQDRARLGDPAPPDQITYADDALAVLEYIRSQPYADPSRIHVYGVSLGGDVVMNLLTRTNVRGAILGAGAPISFLGVTAGTGADRWCNATIREDHARQNAEKVSCPVLIQVGTADSLLPLDRLLYDQLGKAEKQATLEIYENGYHDFVMGPQGHPGRSEPLMDITLTALENTLRFLKDPAKY